MDRPPFGQCLSLLGSAAAGWRDLSATLAVDVGVDPLEWSAPRFLDVIALLQRRSAAANGDELAAERADAETSPDGYAGWGAVSADEAAAIVAADNAGGRR